MGVQKADEGGGRVYTRTASRSSQKVGRKSEDGGYKDER